MHSFVNQRQSMSIHVPRSKGKNVSGTRQQEFVYTQLVHDSWLRHKRAGTGPADPVVSRAAVVWQMEGGGPSFWVALRA